MDKTKLFFLLALGCGLFLHPVSSGLVAAPASMQVEQETIPYAALVNIFDQLATKSLCTRAEAECWYRNKELGIEKISGATYRVILPGGGMVVILDVII